MQLVMFCLEILVLGGVHSMLNFLFSAVDPLSNSLEQQFLPALLHQPK